MRVQKQKLILHTAARGSLDATPPQYKYSSLRASRNSILTSVDKVNSIGNGSNMRLHSLSKRKIEHQLNK